MRGQLHLARQLHDEMVEHARSDFPFEVCGLLAGRGGVAERRYPVANDARSMTYYQMQPKGMLDAMTDFEDDGLELVGIYHSHTHTEAYPSPTDVELAAYPDVAYVIVSLQDPERPVIRAFDIVEGSVTERVVHLDGRPAVAGPR